MKQFHFTMETFQKVFIYTLISTFIITFNRNYCACQDLEMYNQLATRNCRISYDSSRTKRFWRATAEWSLAQLLPWSADRYVRNADFAKIDLQSIKTNVRLSSWEWDDNQFLNNQIAHPFHGSLYFNAFRSNGYSFWESVPPVFMGTYVWETIMEKHYPAPNDLINTALGGIVLGEMSNRVSGLIIGHRKNKTRAFLQDPAALLINPMGGLTRMTSRQWGKPVKNLAPPALLHVESGYRMSTDRNLKGSDQQAIYTGLHLQYGDVFETSRKAFNNFSMEAELSTDDSSLLNTMKVEGSLYSKKMATANGCRVLNITMNYDYMKNHFFKYGAEGIRVNYLTKFEVAPKIQLQFKAGAGILLLGAIPNTYMLYGEGRDYDYCTGITLHLVAGVNFAERVFLQVNSNAGQTATVNGYQSSHVFHNSKAEMHVRLLKNFTLNATVSNYYFNGYYTKMPHVFEHYSQYYIGAGYKFYID